MPSYYGLLFSHPSLPWDDPIRQGQVFLEEAPEGVEVLIDEESLGLITTNSDGDAQSGCRLALSSDTEVVLFVDERHASSWQSWARREKKRWDHLLDDLLQGGS